MANARTNARKGGEKPSHGLFYMENAGGIHPGAAQEAAAQPDEEHRPGCFAREEEMGAGWSGRGAAKPAIKDKRPRL